MTSSVAGPRRSSTELSKTKLAPKKCSWSLFGGQLPIWSTIAFWILVKLLHLRSMLSKFRCAVNCNTCSQRWSTERAQPFSTTTPYHMSHNQCFKSSKKKKVERIGLRSFASSCHIHQTFCQLSTTSSSISTLWRENVSTTSRRRKMLSKSLWNPEAQIFTLQE